MTIFNNSTKAQQLKKAQSRQKNYTEEAESLKRLQEHDASHLYNNQQHNGGKLDTSQQSAASVLIQSQKDAAIALKSAHDSHESRLKIFQKTERKNISHKNQMISWLTGGYSLTNNDENDQDRKDN